MKINQIAGAILLLWIGSCTTSFGQVKSVVSTEYQHLVAKMDNRIRIVVQQSEPVSLKQLNATLQVYNSEKVPIEITEGTEGKESFIIRPDTVGLIEINITIGDTIETKTLMVKPIEAVGRLGRYGANTDEKFGSGEFKAQMGIGAFIECCGIRANCQVLGFQAIRIGKNNQVERAVNNGARFNDQTRRIIMKAEAGDIFMFRQMRCLCPGSAEPQRLDDMIFEIE